MGDAQLQAILLYRAGTSTVHSVRVNDRPGLISPLNRRDLLRAVALAGASTLVGGSLTSCLGEPTASGDGIPRLQARPMLPTVRASPGRARFDYDGTTAVAFIPSGATWEEELGLMVFLHGALRTVDAFVDAFQAAADSARVIVIAPFARAGTWDAVRSGFGPDPARIDAALRWTFERWRVDPERVALAGFSDGATYALAVGRANGDLFPRLAAFSPGFLIGVEPVGRPRILVTHGDQDIVLSIIRTREIIVPDLREMGYEVDFREFSGPHAVPAQTANSFITGLGRP